MISFTRDSEASGTQGFHITTLAQFLSEYGSCMAPVNETSLMKEKERGIKVDFGKASIPDAKDLRLRICVIEHSASACHRGSDVSLSSIQEHLWWSHMDNIISVLCFTCLLSCK